MIRSLLSFNKGFENFSRRKCLNRKAFSINTHGNGNWETVVGLEIHAQIASKSKLFSSAPNQTENVYDPPNTKVSFVDAAFPGTLPVVNKQCIDSAIKTGLALQAKISNYSTFDRKHYFYCDLPHGFQITQYHNPIVRDGKLNITFTKNNETVTKAVDISHIQLEVDSGKSIHDQHPDYSLIDFNRAGAPLMEIVTRPDMRSAEEAGAFVAKLQHLLKHIGTSNANMDLGEFRCDVNVSVHHVDDHTTLGVRTEIKNLNSIKFVMKAIEYEAKRHIELLEKGETPRRETRFFDPSTGTTYSLRRKEDEVDYRFMPEPDLPPIVLDNNYIEEIKNQLPELPDALRERYTKELNLSSYDTDVLINSNASKYFEEVAKNRNAKKAASWILNDLYGLLNSKNLTIHQSPVTSSQLGFMIDLIENGYISGAVGKEVLELMFHGDTRSPKEIVDEKGWGQTSDTGFIEQLCAKVIEENPKEVAKFKQGNQRILGFFVGNVLKASKGKANPKIITDVVTKMLNQ